MVFLIKYNIISLAQDEVEMVKYSTGKCGAWCDICVKREKRTCVREFKWKPPRCKWLDWDMTPLDGWQYSRIPLKRVVELAKEKFSRVP